ncbi:P3 protein isoform X2 [Cherax quadricarinatus]|uniref:P3 protein isoform X2 n=1 Tax=Cherax quadricarinatus TaxID=27406 RepID=UPI00387E8C2E
MQLRLMYGALVVWVGMASLASFVTATVREPKVNFYFNNSLISIIDLKEGEEKQVTFYINDLPSQVFGDLLIKDESDGYLNHLMIAPSKISLNTSINKAEDEVSENGIFEGSFNVTGRFLGFTNIKMVLIGGSDNELIVGKPMLVKISYAIGYGIFYDTPEMWLGLFLTGCSPGGGGSNMWTYLLGGSLDLSVTMTFISTVGAFAALPLWVYALARTIFHDGHFSQLPYKNIAMLVVGLVLPLSIGLLIKRWSQRGADVLKRLLKPISIIFIIFIMTFGVYANFYIFAFFNWRVAVAGVLLPWLGFLFGAVASLVCRRNVEELIAISIETGVQNTGLSIGILKVALKEYAPLGDITIVIPIAVATMTPIPLTIAYIIKRILACTMKSRKLEFGHLYNTRNDTPMSASNSNTPLQ